MRTLFLIGVTLLPVAAQARVKAEILCGVFKGKKVDYTVPADPARKLDKKILCSIELAKGSKGSFTAIVSTGGEEHRGAISPDDDFEIELLPGKDFQSCTDFTIDARLEGPEGKLWSDSLAVAQGCPAAGGGVKPSPAPSARGPAPIPVAPPVGTAKVEDDQQEGGKRLGSTARFGDGADTDVPDAARGALARFADLVVDGDGEALHQMFPKAGLQVRKKKMSEADFGKAGGVEGVGIRKYVDCDDRGRKCRKWGLWQVNVQKGKREIWIYPTSDSGYGKFACAVFTQKGDQWAWTAVKDYDTGEP